MKASGSCRAPF